MFKRVLALLACAVSLPAFAGEAGDLARQHLYAGTLAEAKVALAPLGAAGDTEAQFGLGLIEIVDAIGSVSRAFYRHGAVLPGSEFVLGSAIAGSLPANPTPEPLDYAAFRSILETFVAQLDTASVALETAGAAGDYVVPVDLLKIRVDIDGNGTAEEGETVANALMAGLQIDPAQLANGDVAGGAVGSGGHDAALPNAEVGFDRADAIWLAGYANVIAAQADFLLAHDFSEFFNASFHRLFPAAGLPMQNHSNGGRLVLDSGSDNAIADAIAAIHTINWPVTDPARLKRVHTRLGKIVALSRQNWDAILLETDDNRELLPSPRQTSLVPEGAVTDEMVAAWRATLDVADRILAGELLIPHWRFKQGFDLNTYFETATRTDFVMILSGYGALPYLRDGPIATADSFAEANRVFGDNLLGYAFWFN